MEETLRHVKNRNSSKMKIHISDEEKEPEIDEFNFEDD